ncbi:MAG TPA: lactate utilization protein [Patescibacteria group bacterium]|nr:lactate utilization protein [Patescibacteria group bacterium]
MKNWTELPDQKIIEKTIESLKANGIDAFSVENGKEAKEKALELIPQGAEIMTMTSVTLDSIGLPKEINESGKYDSVRNKLNSLDRKTQGREMQKLGAAPEWVVGSVHGITQDGKVLVASNTGSQLPAYVYGSDHVVWVVGAQKIVKDLDEAWKRLYEHTLPLESERLKKIYNVPSFVSKVLIVQKEIKPGRITMIIVKEVLGF